MTNTRTRARTHSHTPTHHRLPWKFSKTSRMILRRQWPRQMLRMVPRGPFRISPQIRFVLGSSSLTPPLHFELLVCQVTVEVFISIWRADHVNCNVDTHNHAQMKSSTRVRIAYAYDSRWSCRVHANRCRAKNCLGKMLVCVWWRPFNLSSALPHRIRHPTQPVTAISV